MVQLFGRGISSGTGRIILEQLEERVVLDAAVDVDHGNDAGNEAGTATSVNNAVQTQESSSRAVLELDPTSRDYKDGHNENQWYNIDGKWFKWSGRYSWWWYDNGGGTGKRMQFAYDDQLDQWLINDGGWKEFTPKGFAADPIDDFIYDGAVHNLGGGWSFQLSGYMGTYSYDDGMGGGPTQEFRYDYQTDQWQEYNGTTWANFGDAGCSPEFQYDGNSHLLANGWTFQYDLDSRIGSWTSGQTEFTYGYNSHQWAKSTDGGLHWTVWGETGAAGSHFVYDGAWHELADGSWYRGTGRWGLWCDEGAWTLAHDYYWQQWWKWDGGGWQMTYLVELAAQINPSGSSYPTDLTAFDSNLYFNAYEGTHGYELWKYDPAAGQASLVADINQSSGMSSDPTFLTVFDGNLYFNANDGIYGYQLWKYDPNTDEASLAVRINQSGSSDLAFLTELDGDLYFAASDGISGRELWKYDPISDQASLVADINDGPSGSYVSGLIVLDGDLYFVADDGVTGCELWKYDPISDQASLMADINPSGGSVADAMNVLEGDLYFAAAEAVHGVELWKYDPVSGEASLAADIISGPGHGTPFYATVFDGDLYFSAFGETNTCELWRYDPVSDQASLAATIYPLGGSYPHSLCVFGGNLYFSARDGIHGEELWRYDPVSNEAALVYDVRFGPDGSSPSGLAVLGGNLYFAADSDYSGRELWTITGFPSL